MSLFLAPLLKNLFRVALKTVRFLFSAPRQDNVDQMQGEEYNLKL